MSDRARNYVKRLDNSRVTASQKQFLFFLADYHAAKTDSAWPSQETLAADMNLSIRQVRRLVRQCAEKGIVSYSMGIGRGNLSSFRFPELECPGLDGKADIKADIKEDICDSAIRKNQEPGTKPPIVPLCEKHPDSGMTNWGTCWSCYSEKHTGPREDGRKEPQRATG